MEIPNEHAKLDMRKFNIPNGKKLQKLSVNNSSNIVSYGFALLRTASAILLLASDGFQNIVQTKLLPTSQNSTSKKSTKLYAM